MRKITLEDEHGTYSIELTDDLATLSAVVSDLIIPVLLAAGYQPETIKDCIGGEE